MAFTGAITAIPAGPAGEGPQQFKQRILGLALTAFVANPPVAANGDTGVLTTAAVPAVNQNALPATFGYGPGRWRSGDENLVAVALDELSGVTQGAAGQLPSPHQTLLSPAFLPGPTAPFGDLVITVHNRGLLACPTLSIELAYKATIDR